MVSNSQQLRVAILGAGGLGSKIGGYLALSDSIEVRLIARNEEHVKAVRSEGLTIVYDGQEQVVDVAATTDADEVGEVDVVIVVVKAYDTASAARAATSLAGPHTAILTFQNGLGNLEILEREFGSENGILGVTFHGATLLRPGRAGDMGRGPTYIAGSEDLRVHEKLEGLATASAETLVPIEIRHSNEVDGLLWGKLAIVSGINPLAAVLRLPNGTLGSVSKARSLSLDAIRETMAVATAKGVTLAFDPIERFDMTTRATERMKSGTLLDVLKGNQTEIPAISGAIAAEGNRLGVPTPVQTMLARLVAVIEATYESRVEG